MAQQTQGYSAPPYSLIPSIKHGEVGKEARWGGRAYVLRDIVSRAADAAMSYPSLLRAEIDLANIDVGSGASHVASGYQKYRDPKLINIDHR